MALQSGSTSRWRTSSEAASFSIAGSSNSDGSKILLDLLEYLRIDPCTRCPFGFLSCLINNTDLGSCLFLSFIPLAR